MNLDRNAAARAVAEKRAKDRAYVERTIEQDYELSLDELTALMFIGAGPLPPAKPYSDMSVWKGRAQRVLMDYVFGRRGFKYAKQYVPIVVLFLCRRFGRPIGSGANYTGWETSYMHLIKAARKRGDLDPFKKVQHGRRYPKRADR